MTNEQRVAQEIAEIKAMMDKPGGEPVTSMQLKHRADRRSQIATGLMMAGLPVRPEYRND